MNFWKQKARELKRQTMALYLAFRDPRTPWYARLFTALVVAYAFSPIDLIPDFIPVLGYLDDLLLVPLGVYVALKLIPPDVMIDARARAAELEAGKPVFSWMGVVIVLLWLLSIALVGWLVYRWVNTH